jgi:predicted pyridoxine 5'-phosphate oxidase superfamily flavin-nucleotide-binding protein
MTHRFAEIAFTDSVKATQEHYRSRSQNERFETHGGPNDALGPGEAEFIAARDSFYMATVSETAWPYVQHRGGPTGFLRVLGPRQLAFADFRGNTQYVSVGNVVRNDRVALILMDYPNRMRLKILGRMRSVGVAECDPEMLKRVELPTYRARVERIMLIDVEAFDWNCPQHITPRFSQAEVEVAVRPLKEKIGQLEARLHELGAEVPHG